MDSQATDGRTDMTKLIVGFRKFANAPKSPSHNTLLHENRISPVNLMNANVFKESGNEIPM